MIKKILRRAIGRNLFGNFLRIANCITLPKPIERSQADQENIDIMTKHLSLYNFSNCPFCIKVRRFMHENSINIEILDAANDDTHKSDLMNYGGKYQAPCLRISEPNGEDEWLYESDDIISYLKKFTISN